MSANLYFINIIAKALQESNAEKALKKAFRKIKLWGSEERYAEGFENFELFMQEAYDRHRITATDYVRELMIQRRTDMLEGLAREKESLLDIIDLFPEVKMQFEAICRMAAKENLGGAFPVIEVSSDQGIVIEKTFNTVPGCGSFAGISPGGYRVKLVNTGWIIWEGKLTGRELIWPKGDNLLVAAKTRDVQIPHSRKEVLLDGDMVLCTYAGIESGSISIELTR